MKRKLMILIFFLFISLLYICNIDNIKTSFVLMNNENINIRLLYGLKIEDEEYINTSSSGRTYKKMKLKAFNVPVKEINVTVLPEIKVVPLGNLIGLKIYTKGVLVVGVEGDSSKSEIQEGDIIIRINEKNIESIKDIKKVLNKSNGKNIKIEYFNQDKNKVMTSNIKPNKNENEDYELGLWVKEGASGVGTISFYIPETNEFASLGHGIYDRDTDVLLNIENGKILTSKVIAISKAEGIIPGEIRGSIDRGNYLGEITKNSAFGVYGKINNIKYFKSKYKTLVKVASRNEIEKGDAIILSSLDGEKVNEYKIKIKEIYLDNNENNRSMKIEVVDKELLDKTGGIICGMSGSPIIQNGKLIGCITNVLVNNSKIGYAIFADIMIKEMVN